MAASLAATASLGSDANKVGTGHSTSEATSKKLATEGFPFDTDTQHTVNGPDHFTIDFTANVVAPESCVFLPIRIKMKDGSKHDLEIPNPSTADEFGRAVEEAMQSRKYPLDPANLEDFDTPAESVVSSWPEVFIGHRQFLNGEIKKTWPWSKRAGEFVYANSEALKNGAVTVAFLWSVWRPRR